MSHEAMDVWDEGAPDIESCRRDNEGNRARFVTPPAREAVANGRH